MNARRLVVIFSVLAVFCLLVSTVGLLAYIVIRGGPTPIATETTILPPTSPVSTVVYTCYQNCWQIDDNTRTLTWTGPTDGTADIWSSGESTQKIQDGYTAIFTTSAPGMVSACVLTINGTTVRNSCGGGLYQLPPGSYQVTSPTKDADHPGGFCVIFNLDTTTCK